MFLTRALHELYRCSGKKIESDIEQSGDQTLHQELSAKPLIDRSLESEPVIDGICAVIKKAEMMVKYRALTGTHISRKLSYAIPDANARARLFES